MMSDSAGADSNCYILLRKTPLFEKFDIIEGLHQIARVTGTLGISANNGP